MKYTELKLELRRFEEMYGNAGPLVSALRQARLAISDLETELSLVREEEHGQQN